MMDAGLNSVTDAPNRQAAARGDNNSANAITQFARLIAGARAADTSGNTSLPAQTAQVPGAQSQSVADDPPLANAAIGAAGLAPGTQSAPVKKRPAAETKRPEYDRLFADGKLETTIAVGFDDHKLHEWQTQELQRGLRSHGYTAINPKTTTADQLKAAGIDPDTVDRDVLYYTKSFEHDGREVKSVVKLITPNTPNAKGKFADAMAGSELVTYAGHGRYGSGPDFDGIKSPDGNFVIGKPYEAHYEGRLALNSGRTDLQEITMTKNYQLMMFNACKSNHYVDDLRAMPGKDSRNLDLFVTTEKGSWTSASDNLLLMLDGITARKSIGDIQSNLTNNEASPSGWTTDGFDDN
jgi:hypothetical protein